VSATWPENVPGGGPFPVVLPAVELNPLPVELGGLVVQSRSNRTAVPGATVKVDHPTLSVVALRTPLRLPHGRNTVVRGMTVVLAGPVLKLTADVRAGSATIALDDPNAVAAGDVLCLDWRQRLELARVLTPEPARGEAVLEAPLGRSYSAWTEMKLATLTPTGPTAHLDRASAPAAGLLRLDGPVGGEALRVGAPAAAALERAITGAIADAQGYWALAGVAGVREVRLKPVAPGPPPPPPPAAPRVTWTLDYGQPVNVVNLQLAP
jgi:hypothetical protein